MTKTDLVYQKLLKIVDERKIILEVLEIPTEEIRGVWYRMKINGTLREIIVLKATLTGRQRNFTLAHELGHSALHKNSGDLISADCEIVKKTEQEANEYARNLLDEIEGRIKKIA